MIDQYNPYNVELSLQLNANPYNAYTNHLLETALSGTRVWGGPKLKPHRPARWDAIRARVMVLRRWRAHGLL